jgi:FkbM family methyltransferase
MAVITLDRGLAAARRRSFGWLAGVHAGRRRDLIRLGSRYGGWWVPAGVLRRGTIAYCAGAGEDITFDLELLRRGCRVRTIDPTPRAIEHVASLGIRDDAFRFAPVAVWSRTETVRLYAPRDPSHVSHSVLNLQQTEGYIDVPAESLVDLMSRFGDRRIDLLKLDVEGAEYEVLRTLAEPDLVPHVICVEFDQPQPIRRARSAIRDLRALGYRPRRAEGFNVVLERTP